MPANNCNKSRIYNKNKPCLLIVRTKKRNL